ncbi:unnamed protein product [Linum tenue]|uniref:NAC domain-containing protein n=1 Tax=Linum tenue TaxID=586396 RepID=A0AAV0RJ84_9ROSI|nr:unnamed protein product [Linum tenue]
MRITGTAPGVRFEPEDDQIISYLLDKVTGKDLPQNPVIDCDLNGEDEAWKELFVETGESELYFFTRLRRVKTNKGEIGCGGGGGGRAERTIGSKATWRSSKDDPIFLPGGSVQIGSKRAFTYRPNQSSAAARKKETGDGFSMTEYRLDGVFDSVATDLVMCSVRRKEGRASSSEIEINDAAVPMAWCLRPCRSIMAQPMMGGRVFSC